MTLSTLNSDYGMHVSGHDPFSAFSYLSDDVESKPFEVEIGCRMMHDYTGSGSMAHMGKSFVGVSELDHLVHGDLTQKRVCPMTFSTLNSDYGMNVSGHDPFSAFSCGSDDVEFKPFEVENGCETMHDYTGSWSMAHMGKSFMGVSELDYIVQHGDLTQKTKPAGFLTPDEGSCVTGENVASIKKSTEISCKRKTKTHSSKGLWTEEEDRVLKQLVEKHGKRQWPYIAQMLKGKNYMQCRARWHNQLRPDIKKDLWTEEEDWILITSHAEVGNKWAEIAKKLPGRTQNSIMNHWNAAKRRQRTNRKCRTNPNPVLQNYIKSLNLSCGKSSQNQYGCDSSDRLVHDSDFNQVPELALYTKLLEDDSFTPLLEDGSFRSLLDEKKHLDLMEMYHTQLDF